jgi:asparagine synthase (glutamine-hydrolysing)
MPGIYGTYCQPSKTVDNGLNQLFVRMGTLLKHKPAHDQHCVELDNVSLGKISFPSHPYCVKPSFNKDKSMVLLLDGAIFSYTDRYGVHEVDDYESLFNKLREEYEITGSVDVRKINGEFNLAVYDVKHKRLLIMNDRWGFRELYYHCSEGTLMFAPEVKAIMQYEKLRRTLDEMAITDFLHYGYILGNKTFFEEVSLLPPATTLSIDENGFSIKSIEFSYQPSLSAKDYTDHVDTAFSLLNLAVSRRMRYAQKPALQLSGGLDSRLIAGFAARHSDNIDLFTLGGRECGEYRIAKQVAKSLSLKSHVTIKPCWQDIVKYAEPMVWAMDGMVSLTFISPSYGTMCGRLNGDDLMLGGFGGDHTIGGSRITPELLSNSMDFEKRIELMYRRTTAVGDMQPFADTLFQNGFRDKFVYYGTKSIQTAFSSIANGMDEMAHQQDIYLFLTRYRRFLNQARGLVGHATIEQHYPFFDNDFLDFLYCLPPEIRYESRLLVDLFKRHLPELAQIPWLRTGVSLYKSVKNNSKIKRRIVESLKWKIKRASLGRINIRDKDNYAEHDIWYRRNRLFRSFIKSILCDQRVAERGYLKPDGINLILSKLDRGWDYFALVDRMCVFEMFCRLFIDETGHEYLSRPTMVRN